MFCLKTGKDEIAPITTGVTEIEASSTGIVVAGWACNRTDCEAYGKWYCPFSW